MARRPSATTPNDALQLTRRTEHEVEPRPFHTTFGVVLPTSPALAAELMRQSVDGVSALQVPQGWDRDLVTDDAEDRVRRVRAVRAALHVGGPVRSRPLDGDFERVALPAGDCDVLRDTLVAHRAHVVIEIGLAYGSSALAIGEALSATGATDVRHIVIDPYQATSYDNVGWDALSAAGLMDRTTLVTEASSIALARLAAEGATADAAFVDGSHRFHEVFVDLYFLRMLVRPGGLIIVDDAAWPSVAAALRYFDLNLGWRPVEIAGRLTARRVPEEPSEPDFTDFKPFSSASER